ncbi:MAG: hypothetical protein U0165_05035 [Polyangiaceae bacterium]
MSLNEKQTPDAMIAANATHSEPVLKYMALNASVQVVSETTDASVTAKRACHTNSCAVA